MTVGQDVHAELYAKLIVEGVKAAAGGERDGIGWSIAITRHAGQTIASAPANEGRVFHLRLLIDVLASCSLSSHDGAA